MNISFNSFSNNKISLFKENLVPSFVASQRKIIAIAVIAIGFLVASWMLIRRYLNSGHEFTSGGSVTLLGAKDTRQETNNINVIEDKSAESYNKSEMELQQGILISEETISKIQMCMKNILKGKEEGGIKLYDCQSNHRVFALDTVPDLIFKMKTDKNIRAVGRDDSMKARYQKIVNAQTVLRTHQLGLLTLPHAKMITVQVDGEDYDIIAEQKVDINSNESVQEQYYDEYADSLNEAIRQLAVFICKTGYSDVEWRNNPVLNNSLDGDGNRKIALIDVEEMESIKIGLFGGGWDRTGLVGLVNEEQGNIVEKVAKLNGVSTSSFVHSHDKRKIALESLRKLNDYYVRKNITRGNEPIEVDVDSLGLDLYREGRIGRCVKVNDEVVEKEETVNLKTVAEDVVKIINECIQANDSQSSLKRKRYFLLNTNKSPMSAYNSLRLDDKTGLTREEEEKNTWLSVIIQALIDKGHLFKLEKYNGHGYYIQA